jgi:hypothetical protein
MGGCVSTAARRTLNANNITIINTTTTLDETNHWHWLNGSTKSVVV